MPDSTTIVLLGFALLAVLCLATASGRIPERLKVPFAIGLCLLGAALALHAGLSSLALPAHFV